MLITIHENGIEFEAQTAHERDALVRIHNWRLQGLAIHSKDGKSSDRSYPPDGRLTNVILYPTPEWK